MSKYTTENGSTFREADDGREKMCNFTAEIAEEIRFVDGISTSSVLKIIGERNKGGESTELEKLPSIEVSADAFMSMNWVLPNWGVKCVIMPLPGVKDDLRTEIQLKSKPKLTTVYKHLGWAQDEHGKTMYLHAGGGMRAKGNDDTVNVMLPPELRLFNLCSDSSPVEGVKAIIDVATNLTKKEIMWPLVAGAIAPIFGSVDFAVHLSGRTGTFKSEVMSLMQSFYGAKLDSRQLPGSWSSTCNALEAQAFFAKNAAFTIDDFIPTGSSYQIRTYQANADRIIRSQGNQSGRARMTDTSSLQQTMYPRGIILSTGEDTPEGHSCRARMMILELSPGDIDTKILTIAQKLRPQFVAGVAGLIQDLAGNPGFKEVTTRAEELRKKLVGIGHSRTPSMLAKMVAVLEAFFAYAAKIKAISEKEKTALGKESYEAIITAGEKQQFYMEDSDPCEIFMQGLRTVLANKSGHLRTLNGGIPDKAETLGWICENPEDDMPQYKTKNSPTIGWISWNKAEIYLEQNIGFAAIKKACGNEFSLTKQTLIKRLKDAGALARCDDARQRNTCRISAENHPRQVIVISTDFALNTQEVGDDNNTIDEETIDE